MLIPYSTDAPIYHYPIATCSLIAINVFCFFAFCIGLTVPQTQELALFENADGVQIDGNELIQELQEAVAAGQDGKELQRQWKPVRASQSESPSELMLHYGRGLRPWQWLTSMFMHSDLFHLLGNMIFLWSFGLLLEGKLGWWLFSAVYLGMGGFQSALEQCLMLFSSGGSLGASSVISSLLALVVVFAPLNSFESFVFIGVRAFFFEIPNLAFGGLYVVMNVFFFFVGGATFGSEALHLMGFVIGLPVGLFLLTRGYVDCEGYDIISHYTNKEGTESEVGKKERIAREAKRNAKLRETTPKIDQRAVRENMTSQVDLAIQEGNFDLAVALQAKIATNNPGAFWTRSQLIAVIQHYLQVQQFEKAEPLLQLHIEQFEEHRFQLQHKLIKIWLHAQRPRFALRYMKGLNPAFLSDSEKTELQKLANYAQKQIQSGVLETQA